jgi:hypothetical protein
MDKRNPIIRTLAILLLASFLGQAHADASDYLSSIKDATAKNGVSESDLRKIIQTRSGWSPWKIEIKGEVFMPDSKTHATNFLSLLQKRPWYLRVEYKDIASGQKESFKSFYGHRKIAANKLQQFQASEEFQKIKLVRYRLVSLTPNEAKVGLGQIDMQQYGTLFESIESAIEPATNIDFTARMLRVAIDKLGDSAEAVNFLIN